MSEAEGGIIGGVNPVLEALRAQSRKFERIYLARARNPAAVKEILDLARVRGVAVQRVDRVRLDRLYGGRHHQGVVARVGEYAYFELDEVLARIPDGPALVVVLDHVVDPMNLGSLVRSATAAGAGGMILPRERAAPMSPAAIKASAGAAERLPVARVVNLARALDDLKDAGFWILGTDAGAEESLYDRPLERRLGLVIGSEEKGLRRLVREKCDRLASVPLPGPVESLSAGIAGAVVMFEYVRQTRA